MPTLKQKKAIKSLLENKGKPLSKALIEAGYPPTTAKNPQQVMRSKGFQELCEEYGLTDDLLVRSLVQDIKKKPGKRKQELELGFKVKGHLRDVTPPNQTVVILGFNYHAPDHPDNPSNPQTAHRLADASR